MVGGLGKENKKGSKRRWNCGKAGEQEREVTETNKIHRYE
jgi:hypothetical protein